MSYEVTFKISDFLERVLSLTKEDLIRSGSRIVWQDHIERLIKQEGVYWLIALDREFVFDLATRDGMIYLIRNYKSNDHNSVFINLNYLPKGPCIIQVAWDMNFIELIISLNENNKWKDYKSRKDTEHYNTPIELIKWIDKECMVQIKEYPSEEDFRSRLLEIIKGIQRYIDTYSNLNEFWTFSDTNEKKLKYSPKEDKEIHYSIINIISDQLKAANINYSSEYEPQTDYFKIIFSSRVVDIGASTIVMVITKAHSRDLTYEITNKLPSYMKSYKSKFGIFLVLWFKGERFNRPSYDSVSSMELHIRGSLNMSNRNKIDHNNISEIVLDLTGEMKPFRHLNIANNSNLKFTNINKEIIATYNNKKIIFGTFLIITKRNVNLTDSDYLNLAKYNLREYCSKNKLPLKSTRNITPIYPRNIKNDYSAFYKYIKTDIFENFIINGSWQLGTIEQYRTIENNRLRDEFEGFSFLNLTINNHIVSTSLISGFNYLIFCGTRSKNSAYHKENFGKKILYFPNIKSFAEIICKVINAKRYYIQNVEYNTLKMYISNQKIYNQCLELNNIYTPPFFDILNEHLFYPSLFVKPESFKQENEVRIVFELDSDCFEPYKFEDKSLLNYIEY